MSDVTLYDASLTQEYERLFDTASPFNWLSRILEEYAVSALPQDRAISILDVACGVGSYCRRLAVLGYRDIVGVDSSRSQVEACLANSAHFSDRLSFIRCEAARLGSIERFRGRFNVVNASWLYDTARDEGELFEMAWALRQCLKPGGLHMGVDINFDIHASGDSELDAFGISLMDDRPPGCRPRNGEMIAARIAARKGGDLTSHEADSIITTRVTFFDEDTYRTAFAAAGFSDIRFTRPDRWCLGHYWHHCSDKEKFERYIATNPEMIGFAMVA
jgi:SAM-dependent methyltransferase